MKSAKTLKGIGHFASYDNQTLSLLEDAISRLYWAASDRVDTKGKLLSQKLEDIFKEYKRIVINGKRDSKTKDSQEVANKIKNLTNYINNLPSKITTSEEKKVNEIKQQLLTEFKEIKSGVDKEKMKASMRTHVGYVQDFVNSLVNVSSKVDNISMKQFLKQLSNDLKAWRNSNFKV